MGFDPASMALMMGVAQGVMGHQQGKAAASAARQNQQAALLMAEREEQVKRQNLLNIQAQEKDAIKQQEYANEEVMGAATAAVGATGVQTTGTMLDLLAEEVILGANKNAVIRSQSLRQQTQASNAGNLAVYQNEYKAYTYGVEAREAKRKGTMALLMGIGQGALGFTMAGGNWGSLFGTKAAGQAGNTLLTQASSQLGYGAGGLGGTGLWVDQFGFDPLTNYFGYMGLTP